MRLMKLSTSLLAAAALTACGGEIPQEHDSEPNDRNVLEEVEPAPTGIGEKPTPYVDACDSIDGVMPGDFFVRHNGDLAMLDGVASVEGDLTLSGVTAIADLSCLRTIGGDLVIQGTDFLKELHGLDRLEVVSGSVRISENAQLASLAELATLKRVGGDIVIERNEALRNLEGIANVGGSLRGGIFIRDNDALQDVDGFRRIDAVLAGVVIAGNPVLESVSGFAGEQGIVTSFGDVIIEDNEMLGRVELPMMGVDDTANSLILRSNARLKEAEMHSDGRMRVSGDVVVRENPALRTLAGFYNVQHIMGDLRVEDNDALSTFDDLSGLEGVARNLVILSNDNITNLDMTALESVGGDLSIGRNLSLTALDGLASLFEVFGQLDFFDNPMLSECSIEQLAIKLETGRTDGTCQR